ncbi:putative glycosyltransferase EpsF [Pelotomaculum sp. FP]|uniref:glycosyltransferase family 1 protein n=1 Tax=Pelotomaculum sp. FP TaxID=261474 RepID=UPI0011016BAA|nr:glycosyltransferase family 1 protein [Pelotomaculum sp. FP]TEB14255.1 putative glycosyltransferase EpsF [Pelotomaculum sp. FP]
MEPIRVLHVLSALAKNGAESRIMDIYRNINREKIQFDFAVHTTKQCDFDNEVKSMGARIYSFPKFKIFNYLQYYKEWEQFFKEHTEIQIIHIHVTNLAAVILNAAQKSSVPVRITHSRNSNQSGFVQKVFLALTRNIIFRKSTQMLAVSKEAGEYVFGKKAMEAGIVRILRNAIDARKYTFNAELRKKIRAELEVKDNLVVGHIGRFVEQKNHKFVLDIFKKLQKIKPHAVLILVGIGEKQPQMREYAEDIGVGKSVIFMGSRNDVPMLLQAFDVLLFPSLFEGLPGVVLEAQAAGLPCVISDTITKEVAITDLVKYMSLSEAPKIWAVAVVKQATIPRINTIKNFVECGFNIHAIANEYVKMYMKYIVSN